MAEYQGFYWRSHNIENPVDLSKGKTQNKYIFFKQNNQSIPKGNTILVNPRFRDNTKVFINPNFSAYKRETIAAIQPNVHVNPNVMKVVSPDSVFNFQTLITPCVSRYPLKAIATDSKGRVLVSTKNKLIKIPESTNIEGNSINKTNLCPRPLRKLNVIPPFDRIKQLKNQKMISAGTRIENEPIRRNSISTRFKYIKGSEIMKRVHKNVMRSKHKIVRGIDSPNRIKINKNALIPRKKYVFVNKYNSSSFLANNVIFKNTRPKSLININGIFYRNSYVLKKGYFGARQQKDSKNISFSILKNDKGEIPKLEQHSSSRLIKQYQGQHGILMSGRASLSKLKKSNMPCYTYRKFGKCNGQKNGSCIRIHNPDQIILCSKFLQGACIKKNCPLSHKVSPEKMPTCKYFLEGLCSRQDCQYLHVKISPKADICKNFLAGFCKEGTKCDKRHQFLCPEFEKLQKCSRKRCEYPHTNSTKTLGKAIAKKAIKNLAKKKGTIIRNNIIIKPEKNNVRYYEEEVGAKDVTEETLISEKPKLGSLPLFIPLSK